MNFKDIALHYASLGYSVFPIAEFQKSPPKIENWPRLATTDTATVEKWWNQWPNANIAVHTHGMVVVDVEGGTIWPDEHIDIFFELSELSHWQVNTPRAGGLHYWFRLPDGAEHPKNTSCQPFKGFDIRSSHGYVLVPPSARKEGIYEWVGGQFIDQPLKELRPIPKSILKWIYESQQGKSANYRKSKDDPTIKITKGTRNDVMFRIGSFLRRNGGDEPAVLAYLRSQNDTRCEPPLADSEVRALAARVVRVYPVNQLAQADAEGWDQTLIDISAAFRPLKVGGKEIATSGVASTTETRSVPQRFFSNAPAVIQDYIAWCTLTNRRPQPELSLGSSVALMLALGSRKVYSVSSGGKTNSHGYVVLLADSGEGKERPRECLLEVLQSHPKLEHIVGPENFTSPAAIFAALETQGNNCVSTIDEFGKILGHWRGGTGDNNNAGGNTTALLAVYNASKSPNWKPRAYADVRRNFALAYPHLTILGCSVPGLVWDALGVEAISDGIIGRILFFESPPDHYVHVQKIPLDTDPPQSVLDLARDWAEYEPAGTLNGRSNAIVNPNMQPWRYTPEAESMFEEWCERIESIRKDSPRGQRAIWSRAPEKACKLILAYAIASGPRTGKIDYDCVAWGTELEEFLSRRVAFETDRWCSESRWESHLQRVLRAIQDSPERAIYGHQMYRVLRSLKPAERKALLEDAIQQRMIMMETVASGDRGRPSIRWFLP